MSKNNKKHSKPSKEVTLKGTEWHSHHDRKYRENQGELALSEGFFGTLRNTSLLLRQA